MSTSQNDFSSKKTFNVESPSFTPSGQQQSQQPAKKSTFSSQAASAAPFTPRGVGSTAVQQSAEGSLFNPAAIKEFTPHGQNSYDVANTSGGNTNVARDGNHYPDPFTSMSSLGQTLPTSGQFNPYAGDHAASLAASGTAYYTQQSYNAGLVHPPNYHLYQAFDINKLDLQPYQRSTYDYFIPREVREELQKKMFATQQVLPNTTLPDVDNFHTLVPLDTNNKRNTSSFEYQSWIYKAQNARNGWHYALRRLEGYRLTNEHAIPEVLKKWRKVRNSNVVTVHEAFTTLNFNDSSLIFTYDFHPLAKTLQEHYFPNHSSAGIGSAPRYAANRPQQQAQSTIPGDVLWGYICQIANALQAIHSNKLAARCIELNKVLLTDKNRIRLGSCAILDVVQFETNNKTMEELQQEDLIKFGRLMLNLATNNPAPLNSNNTMTALENTRTKYGTGLYEALKWLVNPATENGNVPTIDLFITGISGHMVNAFDMALSSSDERTAQLAKELENGRMARNMFKLAMINERGDLAKRNDRGELTKITDWSETGERLYLKLFRDYVFHQVDANGRPQLGIGHIVTCLNKLDAGVEEYVTLTTRDNFTCFYVTYKELKNMFERAWSDLMKASD